MILGLDISTTMVGVAVIDNGKLVKSEAWDISKYETLFDKAEYIGAELYGLKSEYNIQNIFIETALKKFLPGKSRADTILKLAKFNGIVSWICYDLWEIKPNYIGALQARKAYGIKVPRGQKAKPVVLEHVLKAEKTFSIQMTRHGNPKPESYDRADAIVIARAGSIMEKQNERPNKSKSL